ILVARDRNPDPGRPGRPDHPGQCRPDPHAHPGRRRQRPHHPRGRRHHLGQGHGDRPRRGRQRGRRHGQLLRVGAGFLQLLLDRAGNQPPPRGHDARRLRRRVGGGPPARGVPAHGLVHRGLHPHPRSPPGARPVSLMRPRLVLIGTGGTIAATAGDARTLTGYRVTQGIDAMLAAIPGAADVADIRCEQPFNVDSRDLTTAQVLRLARAIDRHVRDPGVDGVVVTHGTDSLEETAFFLHLTVRSPKPVVLVGAMRPASALSADGPLNLVNALLAAADPASRGRGVLVVMNDYIVAARYAAKRHTTRVDAFGADGAGVLGTIADGCVRYAMRPDLPDAAVFSLAGLRTLPPVDIITDYQDA